MTVAANIGVTQPVLCRFELGRHGLQIKTLYALAVELDCSLDYLVGGAWAGT